MHPRVSFSTEAPPVADMSDTVLRVALTRVHSWLDAHGHDIT